MRPVAPLRPTPSIPPSITPGGAHSGGSIAPPPASSARIVVGTDVGALRREAELLAKDRGERAGTTHLLVVLATHEGLAGELLGDRRVGVETLKKALRVATDEESPDASVRGSPIDRLVVRAREIAARAPAARRPNNAGKVDVEGAHLLLAICFERWSAAHKTLVQLGVDLARLRGALTQHLTGSIEPRRRAAVHEPAHAPKGDAQLGREREPRTTTTLRPLPTRAPTASPTLALAAPAVELPVEAPTPSVEPPPSHAPKHPKNVRRSRHHHHDAKKLSEPTRFDLDPKLAPTLAAMGSNLTAAAARGELDPVVGRDAEIDHALDVLAKRSANNPCLVGAPGVGKTAIAYGLAQRIASSESIHGSGHLDDRIVVELPVGELLAGTGVRGALAERIAAIRKEVVAARGRIVVFLDEIHALLGGDAGEEAANELKTALARGELPCIGATTSAEYRRTIERDAALARRFSVVEVGELDPEAAKTVVDAACLVLGEHHKCTYEATAKEGAIAWTVRYVPSRALPDKALAALDLAGARARRSGKSNVTREAVATVVSEMADVSVSRLLERDADRFLDLEKHLSSRVVGHAEPMAKIARALRRGAAGLRGNRPLFSALLLGPTGVGKTETAKAIAEVLFASREGDTSALTRIDLSEYSEPHAVARLVGAPPGYVGHEDGGQLTEAVRRRPYQVVLFDEMEKAHRDVLEALLQLLDEGRMTDGRGRTVDFTNTVVILTSNLGAEAANERAPRRLGFARDDDAVAASEEAHRRDRTIQAARSALPPELYNRFDEVIVYSPLGRADARAIARIALDRLRDDLRASRGLSLQVDDEAIDALLEEGFDASLGGRPIRREIARRVEAPLAELLLRGGAHPGDVVWVTVEDGKVVVDLVK